MKRHLLLPKAGLLLLVAACLLPTACCESHKPFSFAFLTDLHISRSATAEEDLRRVVNQINDTQGLAFALVAGDITDAGDKESLQTAKNILDSLRIPYYIVPGNHDTKWSESGATDFYSVFGDDYFRFEYNGFLFLGFNTGPVIRMADGHVVPQDIDSLRRDLDSYGAGARPVIITTHYPLQKGDVDNWYEVTDLLRKYNIRAILNGHHHSDRLLFCDGIPTFVNRQVLRGKAPAGGYTIFDVTADSIMAYQSIAGSPERQWRGGYSLHETYYNADTTGCGYVRPDYSINSRYPFVKDKWRQNLGAAIFASPVEADGNVYIGDDRGCFYCIDVATGNAKWRYESGGRIIGTAATGDGKIVFGSADKHIYCLNAATGEKVWILETARPVLGAAAIADGVAYIGASDGAFRAIDLNNGQLRWQYDSIKGYIETRPLIIDDKVIFGAWDNCLYALNKADGTLVWRWNGGRPGMFYSPAAVWPAAAHGKIFIADPARCLTAIDLLTGKTVWRTDQSMVRETVGLSGDAKRIFSKTMCDSIVCFSTTSADAQQIWATCIGHGPDNAPSMPQEKDGIVFGSTMNGELFAVDSQTGTLLWRHKVSNSIINTVRPLSNAACLYACVDGTVALLMIE
ncbi:MAG: PQQ-binding-like beta-propeller repeat protein [Tannerella sp.]|nr:PQQ-binding-like beta-propeller repeat protein [Tannerella sp.]